MTTPVRKTPATSDDILRTPDPLEGDRWVLVSYLASDGVARIEPFEAIDVPLSELWQEPALAGAAAR